MAPTTTGDIVAKLWNLCNVLKDDGVTDHQYVSELTYLLFLKLASLDLLRNEPVAIRISVGFFLGILR